MRIYRSLAFRLFFFLLMIGGLIFLPMSVLILRENKRHLEYQIFETTGNVNNILIAQTRENMIENDRAATQGMIASFLGAPRLESIRVYGKQGISFSADEKEIGTRVEKTSAGCLACHLVEPPLQKPSAQNSFYIESRPGGGRTLTRIDPVMNERACSAAGCHPDPSRKKVLGMIETRISLADVDAIMDRSAGTLFVLAALAVVTIEILSGLFLWAFVHRRVKKLAEGMQKVGEGDLYHAVEVWGKDELGELAAGFNRMVGKIKAQVELERSYKELQRMDAMKDNLLHMVSHDLRTPMTGITGYAHLLLERIDDLEKEKQKRYLTVITDECGRLNRLISDLLDLQRFEAKKMELDFIEIDIVETVKASLEVFLSVTGDRDLSFHLVAPAGKIFVMGHNDRLKQVVTNLLSNAIKFTGPGGEITVAVEKLPGQGGAEKVRVSVKDTGSGIPIDFQAGLFDKFRQAGASVRETRQGSGLGLALVKEIIEYHGGRVDFNTEPGKGSEFFFLLDVIEFIEED